MRPKSWTSNWRVLSHADGSSWVTFFYEDSLQQRILTDDNTAFVPIQTGGGIGIRTRLRAFQARPFDHLGIPPLLPLTGKKDYKCGSILSQQKSSVFGHFHKNSDYETNKIRYNFFV